MMMMKKRKVSARVRGENELNIRMQGHTREKKLPENAVSALFMNCITSGLYFGPGERVNDCLTH